LEPPRILIVDDEDNIRSALVRWFEIRGFRADSARDGVEAVEKCRANRYDIITMDLEMPRMNGAAAIDLIREKDPDVPILILTGYGADPGTTRVNGLTRLLYKPLRLSEIEEEVRNLLEARPD